MAIYFLGPVQNFLQPAGKNNNAALVVRIINKTNKMITVLVEGAGKKNTQTVRLFQHLNSIPPNGQIVFNELNIDCNNFTMQISSTTILPSELGFEIVGMLNGMPKRRYTDQIRFVE